MVDFIEEFCCPVCEEAVFVNKAEIKEGLYVTCPECETGFILHFSEEMGEYFLE